jgi:peptide/nickel transport system substrate-binding protein
MSGPTNGTGGYMPKSLLRLFVIGGLALLFAMPAVAQQYGGTTLRFIPHADLSMLDPYFTGVYITRNYGYMVYDTLFAMDSQFRPQPQMVDSWKVSDDKLTYTFTLRDGLKFHDGQPVRATDVVASLKRWGQRNDAYGQPLLAAAAAIEPVGDKEFRFALKTPFPVLEALSTLTSPTPFMLPERLAQTDAFTQIKEAIGSGPFKFVKEEWQPGHRVVYVKNPDYVPRTEPPNWASGGKVVKVDRVEWLYIPEAVTAAQALGAGEVDYWENVPSDYAPALERDANIVTRSSSSFMGTVRFNQLHPPFDNVKIRQAVLAVTDQRDYMAAMAGAQRNWRTCFSYYVCDVPEADEQGGEALSGPRDYDKAKRLIGEAGYKGERVVVLDAADIPQLHAEALVTNDLLQRLGLNVELTTAEWGTVIKRVLMREPIERGGWSVMNTVFAYYDMINPATNRFLRAGGLTGSAPGWPTDEKIESLRAAWFAATDDAQRHDLADQIQQRAFEFVPYIPTGQPVGRRAFRKNLAGVLDAPLSFLWNIEKRQ